MRARRTLGALLAASLTIAAGALAQVSPAAPSGPPRAAPAGRLLVTVVTRSDRGEVLCALWRGPRGYPSERAYAVGQARDRTIVNRRGHCGFASLEPGAEYALAVIHDENANDVLDRGIFGIPTEGTGASNDARGHMGPPRYEDARFVLPAQSEHAITIHVGY